MHINKVTPIGLQHVARIQLRQPVVHDELEVCAARQHTRAPAIAGGGAAQDGDQPAQAVHGVADFLGGAYLHAKVGKELELRIG
ncbi:hypothetical protein D3C71_1642170 [compost metagenome]